MAQTMEKRDIRKQDRIQIDFEDVFEYIGEFGLFQLLTFFVIGLSTFSTGFQNLAATFLAAEMDHWCEIPELESYRCLYNISLFAR